MAVSITDDDDPPVEVSFGASSYTVVEGETVDVSVVLSAAPGSELEVPFTHTLQGGASGLDFSAVQGLTFASGETSKTFAFIAVPDGQADRGESVLLGFDALPPGFAAGSPDTAAVSITDAADVPSVEVSFGASPYSVAEGASVTVTVELSEDPGRDVVVPLTHTGQGGTTDSDYSGVPESVTFASGDTSGTFTVSAASDTADDDGESVLLGFGSELPTGFTAGDPHAATVSIIDDPADVPSVQVSYGAASYTVAEGGSVTVAVELDIAPEREVEVALTHTAQGDTTAADYSGVPTSVTFASDETSKTFSFTAASDAVNDDGDSVLLGFGSPLPNGVSAGAPATSTVSITDDDVPPVQVRFGAASYTVDEGSSVTVTVELDIAPEREVEVPLTHTAQGDTSSGDYSLSATAVAFAAHQTSAVFTVSAASDSVDDDGESVVLGFGSGLPTGFGAGDPDEATVSITDDPADVPSVQVSFGAASYTVDEGSSVTVTVELDIAPEREVEVPLTHTAQGDTTAGDYSGVPTSVTFGSSDTEQTFTFTAAADDVDDDGDSVLLGFESPLPDGVSAGARATSTVSITDDDVPPVQVFFEPDTYTVAEDSAVTVTVRLDVAPERLVSVPITAANQGDTTTADYSLSATSVVFAGDETERSFRFGAADDTVDDDDESVVLGFGELPDRVSAPDTTARPATATVSITDDETAPASITLSVSPTSVGEDDDATTVTVTATLGGSATLSTATEVTVSVGGGSATLGTDYAAVSNFTVTIPKESASETGTFTLTPTQDDIAEGDETIDVTGEADGFTVTKAEVTLTDDETVPASITLSVSPTSVGEDDDATTVTVTATLGGSATLSTATEVTVSVGGGSATLGTDYAAVSNFTVTIPKETASETGTFTLTPTQDDIAEGDETIDVTGEADGFTVTKAEVTLTDDETVPASITLSVSPTSVGEDDDATTVTVTATLGGSVTLDSDTAVTVSVGGGSATLGTDYAAVSNFTVTIPKESASETGTFTLTPTQDDIAEGDETIDVTGEADGFTVTKAEVTLTDDETVPASITLSVSPTSVGEDDDATTVTVTATLGGSATLSTATEVTVSVGGGSATLGTDYAAVSNFTVTIPKETASETGTFTLTPTQDEHRGGRRDDRRHGRGRRLHGDQGGSDPDRRRDGAGVDHALGIPDLGRRGRRRDHGDGDRDPGRQRDAEHRDGGDGLGGRRQRHFGHGLRGGVELHGDDPQGDRERDRDLHPDADSGRPSPRATRRLTSRATADDFTVTKAEDERSPTTRPRRRRSR